MVTNNIKVTHIMDNDSIKSGSCTQSLLAIRDTLDVLGGKWRLQILHYLLTYENEKNTFKKIERGINGISAKMLSRELKELEQNQLVSRTVIPGARLTVEYAITEYGKTAGDISQKLVEWGANHRKHILG